MWWLFINSSPPPASLPAVLLFPQVTLSFSLPFIIIPSPVPSTLPSTPGKHVSETVLQSGLQVSCQCCICFKFICEKMLSVPMASNNQNIHTLGKLYGWSRHVKCSIATKKKLLIAFTFFLSPFSQEKRFVLTVKHVEKVQKHERQQCNTERDVNCNLK